jgi:damage-control phosphatase, subfamily III
MLASIAFPFQCTCSHVVIGFELVADLFLADYLTETTGSTIVFQLKRHPWFVSDVTHDDFIWTIQQCEDAWASSQSGRPRKWRSWLSSGKWVLKADPFWTMPHGYWYMIEDAPELYKELSKCSFLFFKGDLHYRKVKPSNYSLMPTHDQVDAL